MKKSLVLVSVAIGIFSLFLAVASSLPVSAQDPLTECSDTCLTEAEAFYSEIFHDCYTTSETCTWKIINQDTADGLQYCDGWYAESCWDEINEKCTIPYDACLGVVDISYSACLDECQPKESTTVQTSGPERGAIENVPVEAEPKQPEYGTEECFNSCFEDVESNATGDGSGVLFDACLQSCFELDSGGDSTGEATTEITADAEDGSEEASLNTQVETATSSANVRSALEQLRDLGLSMNDIKNYQGYIDTGELSAYGGMSLFTDIAGSVIDFSDQLQGGASVPDAAIKASFDNFGVSLVTTIPILKVIDLVATIPDKVFSGIGISEEHWTRVGTQAMALVSPSGVIKKTTELMVQDDWEDIGNALAHGWNEVKNAEGFIDTAFESGKLLAGTVGAGVVALAQGTSDVLGGILYLGGEGLSLFSGLFDGSSAEYLSD